MRAYNNWQTVLRCTADELRVVAACEEKTLAELRAWMVERERAGGNPSGQAANLLVHLEADIATLDRMLA